jgi:hypothetical protein
MTIDMDWVVLGLGYLAAAICAAVLVWGHRRTRTYS